RAWSLARAPPAPSPARARRELEAVTAVLLEHELRGERTTEAGGEVGQQLRLPVAQVHERLVARDLALADGARQHHAGVIGLVGLRRRRRVLLARQPARLTE